MRKLEVPGALGDPAPTHGPSGVGHRIGRPRALLIGIRPTPRRVADAYRREMNPTPSRQPPHLALNRSIFGYPQTKKSRSFFGVRLCSMQASWPTRFHSARQIRKNTRHMGSLRTQCVPTISGKWL